MEIFEEHEEYHIIKKSIEEIATSLLSSINKKEYFKKLIEIGNIRENKLAILLDVLYTSALKTQDVNKIQLFFDLAGENKLINAKIEDLKMTTLLKEQKYKSLSISTTPYSPDIKILRNLDGNKEKYKYLNEFITKNDIVIDLLKIVGVGYEEFWDCKLRYRVLKGGRASKKSKTTALNFICRIMENPDSNLLVIRKTERTLKDSCFSDLQWAIQRLGVEHHWKYKMNPLQLIFKNTGQRILFKGLDKPEKLASISVHSGHLCWVWVEEAFEIKTEEAFNMINECIRGNVPDYLFKQITLTFNPWHEKHWLKKRFFGFNKDNILTMTTTFLTNEFLDKADLQMFKEMQETNPRRYAVAGLGEWGIDEGNIYDNYYEIALNIPALKENTDLVFANGLDFGFSKSYTAFVAVAVDFATKEIYVYDEYYVQEMTNDKVALALIEKGYQNEFIYCDYAEPRSIKDLKVNHLFGVKKAKNKDILHGIQYIQQFTLIISPTCTNFLYEIQNYRWSKKDDEVLNKPVKEYDHLMDALRYVMSSISLRNFKNI